MPPAPRFWDCFTSAFGLDDAACRRWWQATPLTRGQWQQVVDADMGLKPLPARAIEHFNQERSR